MLAIEFSKGQALRWKRHTSRFSRWHCFKWRKANMAILRVFKCGRTVSSAGKHLLYGDTHIWTYHLWKLCPTRRGIDLEHTHITLSSTSGLTGLNSSQITTQDCWRQFHKTCTTRIQFIMNPSDFIHQVSQIVFIAALQMFP